MSKWDSNTNQETLATPDDVRKAKIRKSRKEKIERDARRTPLPRLLSYGEAADAATREEYEDRFQKWRETLLLSPNCPQDGTLRFAGCVIAKPYSSFSDWIVAAINDVRWGNGELAYIDMRLEPRPGVNRTEKKHMIVHKVVELGTKDSFFTNEWTKFAKQGGLIPLGADRLFEAIDRNSALGEAGKGIVLVLCEGAKAMEGVQRLIDEPEVADAIEAEASRQEWVVCAWLAGKDGVDYCNLNFGLKNSEVKEDENNNLLVRGMNDRVVDYGTEIGAIYIVRDNDESGKDEANRIGMRLIEKYGVLAEKIRIVEPPSGAPKGWDDADELPKDVTPLERYGDFRNARGFTLAEYSRNEKGAVFENAANAKTHMELDLELKGFVYFDEFKQAVMLARPIPGCVDNRALPREREDDDIDNLNVYFQTHPYFRTIGKETVERSLGYYARQSRRNPVLNCMQTLASEWNPENESMIPHLLDILGLEHTEYHNKVFAKFMMGSMRRIKNPGERMQNMLILMGKGNLGKSETLRLLFDIPEHLRKRFGIAGVLINETPPLINKFSDKDMKLAFLGYLLVVFNELAGFHKEDVKQIKDMITSAVDTLRRPFKRHTESFPRVAQLAGTVNEDYFLKDETGNRRYWPILIKQPIDFNKLVEIWEPLHAEMAYRAYETEELHYFTREEQEELLNETLEDCRIKAPWETELEEVLGNIHDDNGKAISDAAIIGADLQRCIRNSQYFSKYRISDNSLSEWLKKHGWEKQRIRAGINKRRVIMWIKEGEYNGKSPATAWQWGENKNPEIHDHSEGWNPYPMNDLEL